ncbi:sensor histidine kinase [Aquifex sp.]
MREFLDKLSVGIAHFDERGKALLLNKFITENLGSGKRGDYYYEIFKSLELISLLHDAYSMKQDREGVFSFKDRIYEARVFYTDEGVGLMVEDITERNLFEKLKEEFLSNLSHEVRTPVAAVQLTLETLLAEEREEKKRELITRALGRLKEVSRILEAVYMLSLDKEENFAEVSLRELLEDVLKDLEDKLKEKKISLEADLREKKLTGDREKLRILLRNLVENAVKYNHEGGKVFIRSYRDKEGILLEVEDTGKGIDKGVLPLIFEPFVKFESERGMGLGLYLVKKIVQLHGGSVRVESEKGKGTKFIISFPLRPPKAVSKT